MPLFLNVGNLGNANDTTHLPAFIIHMHKCTLSAATESMTDLAFFENYARICFNPLVFFETRHLACPFGQAQTIGFSCRFINISQKKRFRKQRQRKSCHVCSASRQRHGIASRPISCHGYITIIFLILQRQGSKYYLLP